MNFVRRALGIPPIEDHNKPNCSAEVEEALRAYRKRQEHRVDYHHESPKSRIRSARSPSMTRKSPPSDDVSTPYDILEVETYSQHRCLEPVTHTLSPKSDFVPLPSVASPASTFLPMKQSATVSGSGYGSMPIPMLPPPNQTTFSPSRSPTFSPTRSPTFSPTSSFRSSPAFSPTRSPNFSPTGSPTSSFRSSPAFSPTRSPTFSPTGSVSSNPTFSPSRSSGSTFRSSATPVSQVSPIPFGPMSPNSPTSNFATVPAFGNQIKPLALPASSSSTSGSLYV